MVLRDGDLLAWLGRGDQAMITFLPKSEREAAQSKAALAEALVEIARSRPRRAMLATIDSVPATSSPFAKFLANYGFNVRRGALVFASDVAPAPTPRSVKRR